MELGAPGVVDREIDLAARGEPFAGYRDHPRRRLLRLGANQDLTTIGGGGGGGFQANAQHRNPQQDKNEKKRA